MTDAEKKAEGWAESLDAQALANYYERQAVTFLGQQRIFQAHLDGQNTGFKNDYLAGFRQAQQDAQPKWVSVKDRLPENNELIVMIEANQFNKRRPSVYFGRRQNELWVYAQDHSDIGWADPTHWMPLPALPEPPEGE